MKTKAVIVSRKFDVESGSAEWILAQHVYEDVCKHAHMVKKIEQKCRSKLFHDWIMIPLLCLWYRMRGYTDFIFMAENQTAPVILLNLTRANTKVYFYDLMRIQNEKKGFDHHYFLIMYWIAARGKVIIADSYKTANEVTDFFGEKVGNKIKVVPPYMKTFTMDKTHRRYNVIGSLGALSDRKRPLKLILLARHIRANKLPYKVEVWGEGHLKEQMEFDVKELELEDIITLKGHAPEKDKEKIINSFGFFFFPTKKEGYGLPAHEAVCCGVPVFILPDVDMPGEVKEVCITIKDIPTMFKAINIIMEDMKYDNHTS